MGGRRRAATRPPARPPSHPLQAETAHAEVVQEGQSSVQDDTNQHFVAFVERGGRLWEMDGRKACPIDHGPTSEATLLEDAVKVVQQFMARDPDEVRFTMVALSAGDAEAGGDAAS